LAVEEEQSHPELSVAGSRPKEAGEESGELVSINLRDLADGSPVSGVSLLAAGGIEFPVSQDGFAEVPAPCLSTLTVRPTAWSIPKQGPEEVRSSGVLWCYRTMRVEGRVEIPAGPTRFEKPPRIAATYSPGVPGLSSRWGAAEPPWTVFWFREHGVPENVSLGDADIDGRFTFEVPRIRPLCIVAQGKDCRQFGMEFVDVDVRTDVASVRIVLESQARVSGRIVGHDGEPIPVRSLLVYSESRIALVDFDIGQLSARACGNALSAAVYQSRGEALFCMIGSAVPDGTGQFDVSINDTGDGLLVAWIPGQRPVRRRLGRLAGEKMLPEIRLPIQERFAGVQFRYRGAPMANCALVAADITEEISQLMLPLNHLDPNGEIDGAWLEPGRKYFFRFFGADLPKGTVGGWILFSGASTVETSTDLKRL
jgi:hypothetical protein